MVTQHSSPHKQRLLSFELHSFPLSNQSELGSHILKSFALKRTSKSQRKSYLHFNPRHHHCGIFCYDVCQHPVRAKQQGIQCDRCLKWNHRTCNTGTSQQQYRAAVRVGAEILWFCPPCCPDPVGESSQVSGECDVFDQSDYILESEEFNPPRESCDVFDQSNYSIVKK